MHELVWQVYSLSETTSLLVYTIGLTANACLKVKTKNAAEIYL